MEGLDCFGCETPDYVGFDYMSLLKGAGGMLSGFGGGGQQQGQMTPQQMQAQMQAQQAQQSANTMKIVLIGVLAALGLGGLAWVIARK